MFENSVHNKLIQFAIQKISVAEAKQIVKASSSSEPVLIFWETLDDGRTAREMYWGRYKGGKASDTREAEGMIALVSVDDGDEYRTVIWDTIWKLKYYDTDSNRYKTVYVN